MNALIKISSVVLVVLIGSCSPDNTYGHGLRCSCQLDNDFKHNIGINCGRTSNGVSSTSGGETVSCEKEVGVSLARGYKHVEGLGLYKIHRTVKDYAHALRLCEDEGASLLVPESAEEVSKLAFLFKDNPKTHQVFIGINDIASEGKYVSLEGVPLSSLGFQTWKSGQPDNYKDEDCLTLTDEGELNDESCSSRQAFLCKRDVSQVPRGYQYVEGFGFYRLYQQKATFEEASRRCERDGGSLGVPDTYDEAAILLRLYDKDPQIYDAWVGISDVKDEGHFVTSTGKPLTALQFQNWGNDEPNPDNPDAEDCVVLHEAGILADYNCQDQKPYICEIPLGQP